MHSSTESSGVGSAYLLVGGGRMARHMGHYLDLLGISWRGWRRGESPEALETAARDARAVLLLISDHALLPFVQEFGGVLGGAPRVHFSGSLEVDGVRCCHPLGSFGPVLHPLSLYRRIVFVCDPGTPDFPTLFPGLPNPYRTLDPGLRGRYHALAVLSGNFTVLLWKKAREEFSRMGLPSSATEAYMETVFANLSADPESGLTGPLVRDDRETVASNLRALGSDPFAEVYRAFVRASGREVPE